MKIPHPKAATSRNVKRPFVPGVQWPTETESNSTANWLSRCIYSKTTSSTSSSFYAFDFLHVAHFVIDSWIGVRFHIITEHQTAHRIISECDTLWNVFFSVDLHVFCTVLKKSSLSSSSISLRTTIIRQIRI